MTHAKIVADYIAGVLSGEIVAGRLVKLAVRRHVADLEHAEERGYYFDEAIAEDACSFFPNILRHSEGRFSGKPFDLTPSQAFIVWCLFGWRRTDNDYRRFRKAYCSAARKFGKGLALDTPMPTPTGWTTMGDIKVGDELFDCNGIQCRVTQVAEDRRIDCYRVTFSNGENIICDGDHLWVTTARIDKPNDRSARTRKRITGPKLRLHQGQYYYAALHGGRQVYLGKRDDSGINERFKVLAKQDVDNHPIGIESHTRTRDTREIARTLYAGGRCDTNHSIAMPQPLMTKDAELPIDPYVLGVWLGDGSSQGPRLSVGDKDLSFMEREMGLCGIRTTSKRRRTVWDVGLKKELVSCYGPDGLKRQLTNLNLVDNKHIPAVYLRASFSQRLSLLQGLMDTDGCINKSGTGINFDTTSEQLRDGASELLASLGIKYSVTPRSMRCNGRIVPGTSYRLFFKVDRDIPVFRMPKKFDRMRLPREEKTTRYGKRTKRSRTVQIVSVDAIDTVTTRCISVDSPTKTYLCGRTMLPTHNTQFAAGLALLVLFADNPVEMGAEIFVAATKEDQANIMHRAAVAMVESSTKRTLDKLATITKKNIAVQKFRSFFRPLGSDSKTNAGWKPHWIILDELCDWQEHHRGLYGALTTATGNRDQPMRLVVCTAGDDTSEIWQEEDDYAVKVLESVVTGNVVDDTYFAFVARIDDERACESCDGSDKDCEACKGTGLLPPDDPLDEECWIKAQPNIGIIVPLEYYRDQANEASHKPTALYDFIRYQCNRKVTSSVKALTPESWARCGEALTDWKLLPAYGAFDLGWESDLSSISIVCKVDEDIYEARSWSFICEDTDRDLNREPFATFIHNGTLTVTPGTTTDIMGTLVPRLAALSEEYNVVQWAYDPANARAVSNILETQYGIPVFKFCQSHMMYNESLRVFLKAVKDAALRHGNDPLLAWCAGNLIVSKAKGAQDLWMPDKRKSREKIDPIVALIMALGGASSNAGGAASFYETYTLEMS